MSDPEDGKEVFGGLPTIRGTMDEGQRWWAQAFRVAAMIQSGLGGILLLIARAHLVGFLSSALCTGGAVAGLLGLQKRGPRLLGLSLVCTVVAFVLAFRHATTVDRLARWDCALAQLSLAEDQMANDIKDMHVKSQLALNGVNLRLGTLDHYLTDLFDTMHRNVTELKARDAKVEFFRRLWKNADAAYITDRLSRLATVAHELANKAVLDRDFKAKLEELTQGVGKALSEGSRRELEGQFEGMTTAAARLATRLQQAERRGWAMSAEDYEVLTRELDQAVRAVVGYLDSVEGLPGTAGAAADLKKAIKETAPMHTVMHDVAVMKDALSRAASGDAFYATMEIGPVDRVREGWNKRFESAADMSVDSDKALGHRYPGLLGDLPQKCIQLAREDMALRWLMVPLVGVMAFGIYAASAALF